MSLETLPSELYSSIVSHLPLDHIVQSVLSLTRALPHAPIPQHSLFRNIRITDPNQLIQFHLRLRRSPEGENACLLVRTFNLESWDVDAEVLLNVVHLLPKLDSLTLWIGPLNFAPQHLEELFGVTRMRNGARHLICLEKLKSLSLRFKPYVQKATYHKFLEGSYFDSTLYAISRWPHITLQALCIVQDPFEEATSSSRQNKLGFAQPIVFFQIDPALPILLRSPTMRSSLTSLRFRLPSRNTSRSFTHPPPPNLPAFGPSRGDSDSEDEAERIRRKYTHETANLSAAPYLKLLDLSTSSILVSHIPSILAKYPSLEHLVMDKCTLLPGELAIRNECGDWAALAKSFALAGVVKAQERQKKVEEWLERLREYERGQAGHGETEGSTSNVRTQAKKTRKGRKGVATATVSLRKEDAPPQQLPPIDLKKTKLGGPREPGGTSSVVPISSSTKRVRVVPSLPTLRSFATELRLPPSHPALRDAGARRALVETIRLKWEEGWAEGITQLVRRRGLMRTSWRNGIVRIVRLAEVDELKVGENVDDEEAFGDTEEGFDGLMDVQHAESFDVDLSDQSACGKAPVLCLAGTDTLEDEAHIDGCVHGVARDVWGT